MSNSVVAVSGVPVMWQIKRLTFALARASRMNFTVINFGAFMGPFKTAYVRVSGNDLYNFIRAVNGSSTKGVKLNAFVPNSVPKLQQAKKHTKASVRTQRHLKIHLQRKPNEVKMATCQELLMELQLRFTGLFNLSRSFNHRLLRKICKIIFQRVEEIEAQRPAQLRDCFSLSSAYRTSYPYTTDFDMILSTLHQLEDADGVPHTELCPKKFSEVPDDILSIGDVSYNQFESICASYADKINKKMKEHVEGLDAAAADGADSAESPQRAAQQRVRAALKNSVPYIESIVRQVLNWNYHSSAEKVPQHHRMRVSLCNTTTVSLVCLL
ncbi:hypothetical protein ACJJTC_014693 [Scirpophaga incertulas]